MIINKQTHMQSKTVSLVPQVSIQDEKLEELDEDFFRALHQTEKQLESFLTTKAPKSLNEEELSLIQRLNEQYTSCIDYFDSHSQSIVVYFQLKLTSNNRRILQTHKKNNRNSFSSANNSDNFSHTWQLGSITEQTMSQLQDSHINVSPNKKEALNHNFMMALKNQDITAHIQHKLRSQVQKKTMIARNLAAQDEEIIRRKNRRRGEGKKGFITYSFSESNVLELGPKRKIEHEVVGIEELSLQALESAIDSPEKLNSLLKSNTSISRRESP